MSHVPQACPQEPSTLDSTDDLVLTWHGKMIRGGGLIQRLDVTWHGVQRGASVHMAAHSYIALLQDQGQRGPDPGVKPRCALTGRGGAE